MAKTEDILAIVLARLDAMEKGAARTERRRFLPGAEFWTLIARAASETAAYASENPGLDAQVYSEHNGRIKAELLAAAQAKPKA
jgi:hypothetical protein